MKHVKIDQTTGEVHWDDYFEYIRATRHRIPDALYEYVSEWGHYSLDGANSLHDAWLSGLRLASDVQEVVIEFLGAHHDRTHVFRYTGVVSYSFDLHVEYTYGDRDVLVHEFSFHDDGLVTHEIVFPNEQRIVIKCEAVLPSTNIRA